ncbi:hypothetical protein AAVH_29490 [Aphelenchoides avenae]|nr:hypothetical protein AAVH_29490 [Aphelenchus avenae]
MSQENAYDMSEICVLPDLDPWDPEVMAYVNPSSDTWKDCKPTFHAITRLVNGRVEMLPAAENVSSENCEFR